jgi:mitochondrial fission protein ELM1
METRHTNSRKTWVLTDGKIGMVNQAMGLAEAVGFETVNKTLRGGFPWRLIPAGLWPPGVKGLSPRSDSIDGTPPDLVISCGRHAVGPALWLKRRHGNRIFVVHVQHPRAKVEQFDLVVAPTHDGLDGPNVLPITGSLHGVTEAGLAEAARRFAPRYEGAPHPLIAVLIGGNNSVYSLDSETVDRLISGLTHIAELHGARLLVTASRRTGADAEARLRAALANIAVEFWDGAGENPYLAYLALADAIVVTCDSVNMISEACSTGKPVYIVRLPGGDGTKFSAFHSGLIEAGQARFFDGRLDTWTPAPLRETERIAREVRQRMGLDPA